MGPAVSGAPGEADPDIPAPTAGRDRSGVNLKIPTLNPRVPWAPTLENGT